MSTPLGNSTKHNNNFDFIRLAAAVSIWFVHCGLFYKLPYDELFQIMSRGAVYTFFIVSGYFVTASYYHHNGRALPYLQNRALRILPAMFLVILVSVFILGPMVTSLSIYHYFHSWETVGYLSSLLIYPLKYTLAGVFRDNPYSPSVNSPLWSLRYEVSCYIAIAVLGYLKILNVRTLLLIFAGFWFLRIYNDLAYINVVPQTFFSHMPQLHTPADGYRLAVDYCPGFAGGAIMYIARDKIPLRRDYAAAMLFILVGSYYLWSECLVYHVALIYLVIWFGFSHIPLRNFNKYGDFSYGMYIYAWPIQELFMHYVKGASFAAFLGVTSVVALLCAVLSWHYVEKPALAHKV